MDAEPLICRTLIGRFRIDRVLGRGGMATVYAAFDQQRGIPVALKVLKRELTRDPMVLRRFEREAKAASHLSHPNVVEVLDWGVDSEEAFIAMELAQGLDLLKALAQQRPMRQTRAVILLGQVCAALSAAHAKGIVHRDLKPENVLIVPDPTEAGGERAMVLDFGIAKMLEASKNPAAGEDPPSYVTKTALTRVGTIVGTPAYMSPEQCRGGDIDGRSDIYACGVLLYQLVTGELPFAGETPLHTAMRHIHAQPRAPSELRRDLDPALERVILKALAKWPGERQQTAEALRDELHATVPGLPDRGDLVLPDRPAPAARGAAAKPNPPQLSSAGPHPNALQLASEGSTGGRLGSPQPNADGAAAPGSPPPTAEREPARAAEGPAPERQESALIDSDPATRQHVGGALGATPLRGVRLGRSDAGESPAAPEVRVATAPDGALSAVPHTLAPHTTQPEVAAPVAAAPKASAADEDDDEPRTFLMRTDDPAAAAPATQASPGPAPVAVGLPRGVAIKTDPLEASVRKDPAPNRAAIKTEPIANHPSLRAQLDSVTGTKEPRAQARTDRAAGKLPLRPKATQTGLTPTAERVAPRPAQGGAAVARQATPAIALSAIPPVPAAPTIARATTDRGPVPGPQAAALSALPQLPPQPMGFAAAAPAAARSAPLEPADDDEPATYIRDPGPASNAIARTLVMEEGNPAAANVQTGLAVNLPGAARAHQHSAASNAPYNDAYGSDAESDALRALKATSRFTDDPSHAPQSGSARPTNPLGHSGRAEPDPQIKATVRMNPQETMARAQAQQVQQAQHASGHSVPPSQSGRIEPTLPGQVTYGQLQPGQWNEPTVVRRKANPAPAAGLGQTRGPQGDGLVNQLQTLSGTTGLLIGIGLGLGLAAGLLIAFLLLR